MHVLYQKAELFITYVAAGYDHVHTQHRTHFYSNTYSKFSSNGLCLVHCLHSLAAKGDMYINCIIFEVIT